MKSNERPRRTARYEPFGRTFFCLSLILLLGATCSWAQIFKTIYNFSHTDWPPINNDGAQPYATPVTLAGNRLYGTTYYGGTNGNGVVFAVNTDGGSFSVLHTFGPVLSPDYTNSDGQSPQGGLTLQGDSLYGTGLTGGMISGGYGTIYSLKTNGDFFTLLHSFDGTNGSDPNGPLIIDSGKIYGTTEAGGSGGRGVIFSMNLDGTGFTVLHTFVGPDGGFPNGITLCGVILFGTAQFGGTNGTGTIYSIKTNGDDFNLLHTFSAGNAGFYHQFNDDGRFPEMPPAISGDTLYGTASFGGYYARGVLFSVKTNGLDFTVLHTFADNSPGDERSYQDGGGAYPMGISVSNGVLYGLAEGGGTGASGVVYAINADGSHFNVLHGFSAANSSTAYTNYDGQYPEGALVLSGNTLYGTAEQGGQYNGTVFSLVIQPAIANLQLAGTDLVLNGYNGVSNENCVTFASTNLCLPLADWTPIATNILPAGNFTITATNAVTPSVSKAFYILQTR